MANINDNALDCASQNKRIAAWLNAGHRITQIEALNLFQCFRLASRIHDLRNKGMDIKMERIITPSGKRVAQYFI